MAGSSLYGLEAFGRAIVLDADAAPVNDRSSIVIAVGLDSQRAAGRRIELRPDAGSRAAKPRSK
jgi:hypothetical protein